MVTTRHHIRHRALAVLDGSHAKGDGLDKVSLKFEIEK